MDLKTWVALIGALIAGAAIIGLFAAVGVGWILLVAVVVGIISYIVAAVGASSRTSITTFGEFMRGWLDRHECGAELRHLVRRSSAASPAASSAG